ncbi:MULTISPECIES: hypothetical protein [unclassified Bradyrhizobium]|uniref:hypothetical protein n=1 Tax=unclassified Bradyrhizobium TaxID=2631580 RepID=UPI001FFB81D6|nr:MULTISPECIES: hypothetical protein [unclassified Bradyrhizobium]MCK1615013.1 hypothetical protein [Bradyrhizobium sp. 163]MCK1761729.1 hypothetical protein [Bradyrhizobium sp. 136]
MFANLKKPTTLSLNQVVQRIIKLNGGLQKFWSKSHGWAPVEAAGLLSKSRLDWQVSLSETLYLWIKKPSHTLTPGELILAWTNLGSLLEGTLKTFLSVWYNDYAADVENLKKANAYDKKKDKIKEPDGLTLEPLRNYFTQKGLLSKDSLALIGLVQQRRNATHAFQNKNIGTTKEFNDALRVYLNTLREVNGRLPYPDDIYSPTEI